MEWWDSKRQPRSKLTRHITGFISVGFSPGTILLIKPAEGLNRLLVQND